MLPPILRAAAVSAAVLSLMPLLSAPALGEPQSVLMTRRTADDIYSPKQVVNAFAASGINLCTVVICSGLVGPLPDEHSWETNFTAGTVTENIYVAVGKNIEATLANIDLGQSNGQYSGDFQARFGNVYVEVSRVSPFIHYLRALPIPQAVTAALEQLAGANAPLPSATQQLSCQALAQRPYGTSPSPTGVTCDGLPGGADTEYWFEAQLHSVGHVQPTVIYHVFSSPAAARRDWPAFLREFTRRLVLMVRDGSIPGTTYPSAVWLTPAKKAAIAIDGTTSAILVGQIIVALPTDDIKNAHIRTIETLTKNIASHVASIEQTS